LRKTPSYIVDLVTSAWEEIERTKLQKDSGENNSNPGKGKVDYF
jgi:hypothetical protein